MSRSSEAVIRRHAKLCGAASNVVARLRHAGMDRDAEAIARLIQSHQWAVRRLEAAVSGYSAEIVATQIATVVQR